MTYPGRPQLFALHFIKWLSDSGAAQEIGPDAFALLVAVAMREDDTRYQRPVNFFNEQLAERCGILSVHALTRARNRAIQAGLLEYEPSVKRRPGRYFVTGFHAQSAEQAGGKREESGRNQLASIPNPIPNPSKKRPRLDPPTVDEVRAYCRERKNTIDPDHFVDHYTANGWTQGKGKPIRDWQAAVRTWERNGLSNGSPQPVAKKITPIVAGRRQK
jgi:hypothetical protein